MPGHTNPNLNCSNKEKSYGENSDQCGHGRLEIEQSCNSKNQSDNASSYIEASERRGQDGCEGAYGDPEETAEDQAG